MEVRRLPAYAPLLFVQVDCPRYRRVTVHARREKRPHYYALGAVVGGYPPVELIIEAVGANISVCLRDGRRIIVIVDTRAGHVADRLLGIR